MIRVFARLEVQNKRRALHVQSRQDVVWFPGLDISPCSIVLGLRGPSEKTLLFDSDREKSRTGTRHGVLLTFRSFSRMLAIVDESEVEGNSFMIRDYPTL